MPSKADILRSYREFVLLANRLPRDRKLQALAQAKSEIRKNKQETDDQKAGDMHKALVGRIGFLRMTLPKQRDRYVKSGTFVMRKGVLVEDTAYREKRCESFIHNCCCLDWNHMGSSTHQA